MYKDDPDVSESGIEVIDSVNEFLNELYKNNLLTLINKDLELSQTSSSSSLNDDTINNLNNYSITSTNESNAVSNSSNSEAGANSGVNIDGTNNYIFIGNVAVNEKLLNNILPRLYSK